MTSASWVQTLTRLRLTSVCQLLPTTASVYSKRTVMLRASLSSGLSMTDSYSVFPRADTSGMPSLTMTMVMGRSTRFLLRTVYATCSKNAL